MFDKLNSVGLKINSAKSELFKSTVKFLGYLFSISGFRPLPERVEALKESPTPSDNKTVQRYLGMFGFYEIFIPHFSEVVGPLRSLLKAPNFSVHSNGVDLSRSRSFLHYYS